MVLQPGNKLFGNRYTIIRKLGEGGFGITYEAKKSDGSSVVIKTLKDELLYHPNFKQFQDKFQGEALALAVCKHPHIVQVDNFFQEGNLPYLAMEYVIGEDLQGRVQRKGILPETEAISYIQQIGEALSFIHTEKGLLHRDVKPNNIVLRRSNREAVLIDFGLARGFIPDMTQQMTPLHTPAFAPPEQMMPNGRYGDYTDVYALAATLYFLLTNTLPTAAPWRALNHPLKPPRQINPKISAPVHQAILEGLAMEVHKRPQSVREWLKLIPSAKKTVAVLATDDLSSAKGVDYSRLRDLLKVGKWQDADTETAARMLEAAGREEEDWLWHEHIDNFPCKDLRTIDQLWVKYSEGRFGFSVQAKIYRSLGETRSYDEKIWNAYADRVGWRKQGHWVNYSNLIFNTTAPLGHLPRGAYRCGWFGWFWRVMVAGEALFSRIRTCKV
ncbi:GUN4 domain-containing protein [Desertifilum sp. FACHB-1129]|uniref:Serine/threonine protein kinase n=2 Tax=Desertifilum tharense IPPAS B-1220 TaxID=1781255 RepID=A0A1E5QGI7_9CYAN|nr:MULTISPECIES: serine/threonine-protein kinase [Desertifilum]MDA0211883.1 serine/threonine-protein kinase [Cyanobacteria bacterium FC1]MBD2314273.1 GUN4 domain-containing protein [Desertifilum sp. FACHB-1129]MBD2320376.1 GUN4 domain-containing protein [Desertifilum sp. FACHB-866]MBD2330504.1 GUN4 domain-containing protein [Desertifilum sp. FACHB-868]OEJ73810.1 serine/threonine protein kinase [Desertifilum tharense IPPAS B-1220]